MLRRLLDSPWTYFVGAGLLVVVALASQFEVRMPSRGQDDPSAISTLRERDDLNVAFFLIDTLRADRLGSYGYPRPTSPRLDELARTGVVFERVVAQSSWTKTSMASLWTATNPARHGVLRFNHALPTEAVLPAEQLAEAGFQTAGIWRNGWVSPNFGFGQGFESYIRPKPGRERVQMQRNSPTAPKLVGTDEDIADSAIEFLENFGDRRFFLYMHFMDVHQYVFDSESAVFGTSYSDAYDQSILWTDRVIAHIVQRMDELGVLERTLLVFASDHGEAFREHGGEGHAQNLYREVVHVPLIFVLPFRLEPGIRVPQTVSNVDVWPTIFDLLGMEPLPGADGRSLVPLMEAASGGGSGPPVFSQLDRRWGRPGEEPAPMVAVTRDNLRLLLPVDRPEAAELYDHASDPAESQNLAEVRPEEAKQLRELADAHLAGAESPWQAAPKEVELDRMRLEQLRALGYVIGGNAPPEP